MKGDPKDQRAEMQITMKIIRKRKAVSNTECPAIRQISVFDPALLVVFLFIYWVVWILMKWIV